MITEIFYPAKCKDCKFIQYQYVITKNGTISNRHIYICNKNSEQVSPRSKACDNFKLNMNN